VVGEKQNLDAAEFLPFCNFSGTLRKLNDIRAIELYRMWALGDGIFETIRVWNGKPLAAELHFNRFSISAKHAQLNAELSTLESFRSAITAVVQANTAPSAWIRVNCWRKGYGSYSYPDQNSDFMIIAKSLPEILFPNHSPIAAQIKPFPIENFGLPVPGIKTASALPWVLAMKDEANPSLYINTEGYVWDAGIYAPLCYLEGSGWIVPSCNPPALQGTMRMRIVHLLTKEGFEVTERPIHLSELKKIRHLWLCNAIQGVLPVSILDIHSLETGPLDVILEKLRNLSY